MSEKINNSYDYDYSVTDFIFCCEDMTWAQIEAYLLLDYDPNVKQFFFKMIYPFHKTPYFFNFCPFCAIDLRKFVVKLKEKENDDAEKK